MSRKEPKSMPLQTTSAKKGGAGTISLIMIVIAIALFVLTRYYILFVLHPQVSDVRLYFEYAARAVDLRNTPGNMPYQETFEIEYPPLALWTMSVPRLIDEHQITRPQDSQQVVPIFFDYIHAFRGLMFLCDLASFVIVILIVRRRRPQLVPWAALMYTITTAILMHLLYDRLDVGLLLLMILGMYSWTRSLAVSGRIIIWTAAAYALIGLSISYKIIPVICVPFLLLSEFHAPRRLTRLACALIALAAGIGLPFAIQYSFSGPGVFDLFKQHAEREIQLESLYSTLMMIASPLGSTTFISHSHGAFNLSGNLSFAMKILSAILLFGFLAGMGIWALLRWSRYSRQDAYRMACYVIPAAVILSNVLSPQYFIWALPMLLLLAVEVLPGRVLPWVFGALLVAVAAMTTWIFPYNYYCSETNLHALTPMNLSDLLAPSSTAYVVLGLRNLTYLGVVLWLGVLLFKRIDQMSNSSNLPGNNTK